MSEDMRWKGRKQSKNNPVSRCGSGQLLRRHLPSENFESDFQKQWKKNSYVLAFLPSGTFHAERRRIPCVKDILLSSCELLNARRDWHGVQIILIN